MLKSSHESVKNISNIKIILVKFPGIDVINLSSTFVLVLYFYSIKKSQSKHWIIHKIIKYKCSEFWNKIFKHSCNRIQCIRCTVAFIWVVVTITEPEWKKIFNTSCRRPCGNLLSPSTLYMFGLFTRLSPSSANFP